MATKRLRATLEHEMVYTDLIKLIAKHSEKVDKEEIMAIVANMLGKIMAMQDQRKISAQAALEIILSNIEEGNASVIAMLAQTQGNA
jgi:hypothetical protein